MASKLPVTSNGNFLRNAGDIDGLEKILDNKA